MADYTALHTFKVKVTDTEEKTFAQGADYDGPSDLIKRLLSGEDDRRLGPLIAKKSSDEAKQATADAKEQAKAEAEVKQAGVDQADTERN